MCVFAYRNEAPVLGTGLKVEEPMTLFPEKEDLVQEKIAVAELSPESACADSKLFRFRSNLSDDTSFTQ